MTGVVLILAAMLAGALLGWLAPAAVARLPEPQPDPDEPRDRERPPKVPYAHLAAGTRVRPWLASWGAVVLGLLAWARGEAADLPAFLVAGAFGVALAWVDVRVHRLPDRLTFPAFVLSGAFLAAAAAADDAWGAYGRAWLGALALFGFYFVLAFLRPNDMGFGDVKLAAILGLLLGWLGWGEVVVGAFLGFLFGGLSGVALMAVRRANRKSAIPFGPFMLLGALAAVIWGGDIVDWYLGSV